MDSGLRTDLFEIIERYHDTEPGAAEFLAGVVDSWDGLDMDPGCSTEYAKGFLSAMNVR